MTDDNKNSNIKITGLRYPASCPKFSIFNLQSSIFNRNNLQSSIFNRNNLQSSILLFVAVIIFFAGCSSAPLRNARTSFYNNQPQKAADTLSGVKNFPKRDKLLLFMEKGLILHYLGKYEESVKELRKASRLMEQQEVISISRQAASFVTTEWITEYKGEYCERLWVHTYLMMNYLVLRKYESALVEAKQALKIMNRHPKALTNDYFTRALIALCFDNLRETNDAYIEYKKLAELTHDNAKIAPDLYRLSLQLGFADEADKYKNYIPKQKLSMLKKPSAELVLFAGLGSGPVKVPDNIVIPPSIRFSWPRYEERHKAYAKISLMDSGRYLSATDITTDFNRVAKASLEERATKIIAKETARATAKEVIAQAVNHKNNNEILEVLVRAAFFLMEEPDTRSWETLPASLKLLRVPLQPHRRYNIKVIMYSRGRVGEKTLPEIMVNPGQRVYHSIRLHN